MRRVTLILMAVLLSTTILAANVGVIDYETVRKSYIGYKTAVDELTKEQMRLQAEIDKKKLEFENDRAALTDESSKEEVADVEKKWTDLNSFVQKASQELKQKEYSKMREVDFALETILKIVIKDIQKDENVDVFLYKQAVLFGGVDYTDKVIEVLEGKAPEKVEL